MKQFINLLTLSIFSLVFFVFPVQAQSLKLYLAGSGSNPDLSESQPTGMIYQMEAVNTNWTLTFDNYYLTEDIFGTNYVLNLRCRSTALRSFTAVIQIGGEQVADTIFNVNTTSYSLYSIPVVGIDPNITATVEVKLLVTINGTGGATAGLQFGNTGSPYSNIELPPLQTTGIDENEKANPRDFKLMQNYPNPFNPSSTISYSVPEIVFVSIRVYDVLGNEIKTLVNEEKHIGNYEVEFDATGLPSGFYFYRLQAGEFIQTKKMILLK